MTFFLFTDLVALAALVAFGVVGTTVLLQALILAPVVEVAVLAGRRLYGIAEPAMVKRAALVLLTVLAVVAIAKSLT